MDTGLLKEGRYEFRWGFERYPKGMDWSKAVFEVFFLDLLAFPMRINVRQKNPKFFIFSNCHNNAVLQFKFVMLDKRYEWGPCLPVSKQKTLPSVLTATSNCPHTSLCPCIVYIYSVLGQLFKSWVPQSVI